ncbi:unnamed protein product [Cunninghamella blakesleeana]
MKFRVFAFRIDTLYLFLNVQAVRLSYDELLEIFKEMNHIELQEFVDQFEGKFEISTPTNSDTNVSN